MSEERVIFPEAVVGDITIKPWSFGILFKISEMLERILDKVDEKNVDLSVFDGVTTFIPYTVVARLFTIASKELLEIVSITVGKSIEEIEALSMEDGIHTVMVIYEQNSTTIKNALTSVLPKEEKKAEEDKVEKKQKEK